MYVMYLNKLFTQYWNSDWMGNKFKYVNIFIEQLFNPPVFTHTKVLFSDILTIVLALETATVHI